MQWLPLALTMALGSTSSPPEWGTPQQGPQLDDAPQAKPLGAPAPAAPLGVPVVGDRNQLGAVLAPGGRLILVSPPFGNQGNALRPQHPPGGGDSGTPGSGRFGTDPGGNEYGNPGHFGTPRPGGGDSGTPGSGKFGSDPGGNEYGLPSGFGGENFDLPQEVEQTFTLLVTDNQWEEGLAIMKYPGQLKSARMEITIEGRWTLLSESLAQQSNPPLTEVLFQGRASIHSGGRDLVAVGNIQHSVQTLFDGLWDWKGPSGEFGSTTHGTEAVRINLPPSKFEGTGAYRMPISGSLDDSYQILGDPNDTAVKIMSGARVTVRVVYIPR